MSNFLGSRCVAHIRVRASAMLCKLGFLNPGEHISIAYLVRS